VGGARAAILPWLEVDYRGALAFSAALHDELWRAGAAPEEALRRARVRCHAADPDAIDPFLFHLVGLGETALAAPSPPRGSASIGSWLAAGLAIAAVGTAAALAFGVRRRQRRPETGTA
ncbi:MAG: hypothetical protein KDE27_28890, partial [Planctomycetes bacterium]|nr:hypothetical protein [Planctomycetota bacterium]